jgi:hypothetical protein
MFHCFPNVTPEGGGGPGLWSEDCIPGSHGLINFKDIKIKYRLYLFLIEFKGWRYNQSCWYFWHSFVNYCPSNLLSSSSPPPPPKANVEYWHCLTGRGWGCWVVLVTIFCRSFWPDSEPTKLLCHHKQKTRRGGGLRQINTCRKVP